MSWDRPEDDTPGDKTEGVRIIGADEAAEALERGDAVPRRGENELKYGDRPEAPPEDVRPAVRFPLPADESEALDRPRVVPTAPPPPSATPAPPPAMPHWTDPPTGEVPRIVPEGAVGENDDDLDAWSSFATSGPRWRDQAGDWEDADFHADELGHDEGTRVGALDTRERPGPSDFFGFDEAEAADDTGAIAAAAAAEAPRRTARPPRPRRAPQPTGGGGRDMQSAVVTGVGLLVVALILFKIGPAAAMILVTAVIVLAAAELFGALQTAGYHPATLLGLVASGSLVLGAYWKSEAAFAPILGLTVIATLLWYLWVHRNDATMNAGVTLLAILQVGFLGSFAGLILAMPNGIGVLIGVILATAANDVGALVVGQQVGRAPVAPDVSPNKTVEGVFGGAVASIAVSVLILGIVGVHPWDTGAAAALGLAVAFAAPLGDLAESMIKRDLGIKDMGAVLPGHGGLFDRFDGLLFALPVAYALCRVLDIA
jgi:phosphatidate cytidylyltransferase